MNQYARGSLVSRGLTSYNWLLILTQGVKILCMICNVLSTVENKLSIKRTCVCLNWKVEQDWTWDNFDVYGELLKFIKTLNHLHKYVIEMENKIMVIWKLQV